MAKGGNKTNIWDFLRDVFIAGINKGQLPVLLLGITCVILVAKVPSEKVPELINKIVEALEHYHILGWIISVASALGWFFNAKRLRRKHAEEMDRVSNEKSRMQNKNAGKNLSSTKGK